MANKNPYLKVKQMEVSSRALFGRPSAMEANIAKWNAKGWELTKADQAERKDLYNLTFVYHMSEDEIIASKKSERAKLKFWFATIAVFAVVLTIYGLQVNAKTAEIRSAEATRKAQVRLTAAQVALNDTATATLWTPTNTPTPSNTPTATHTPTITDMPTITHTPSNTPTLTPTRRIHTNTPEPKRPTNAPSVTNYVRANANGRSCERTDCNVVARLAAGAMVTIIGTVEGENVSGSTVWKQARYEGQTVFIHSSLLSENLIPTNAPVQVQQQVQQPPIQSVEQQPEQQLMSTPVPNAPPSFVPNCSGDVYNCSDLTCNQMAVYWNACPGDPSGLDGNDNDGRYCESKCG